MPLPTSIKELFHIDPAIEEVQGEHLAKTLEHDIPQNIAKHTSEAVGQTHSIEQVTPAIQHDPLAILNPATSQTGQLEKRQIEIDATMPADYRNPETGMGNTLDRIVLNKDGLTTPIDFLAHQKKRNEAQASVKHQVAEEVKKAA